MNGYIPEVGDKVAHMHGTLKLGTIAEVKREHILGRFIQEYKVSWESDTINTGWVDMVTILGWVYQYDQKYKHQKPIEYHCLICGKGFVDERGLICDDCRNKNNRPMNMDVAGDE